MLLNAGKNKSISKIYSVLKTVRIKSQSDSKQFTIMFCIILQIMSQSDSKQL